VKDRQHEGLEEAPLRTLVLAVATLSAFAPLGLVVARGTSGLRDALLCAAALAMGALHTIKAEASPEELDSPPARRAQRFAPFAIGAAVGGLILFPTYAQWGYVSILFFADLPLVAFWHVRRVRAVSLLVATVAGLASTVLTDLAAWCLLPIAAAWALVPALDRLAAARSLIDPRPAPRVAPALAAGAVVVAVGGLLFAAGVLLLPPSVRAFEFVDPFKPRPGVVAQPPRPPDLPIGPSLLLIGVCAMSLLAYNAYVSRLGGKAQLPPPPGAMAASASRPLDPEAVGRAVAAWPAGPRRDVVEAYLRHLVELEARGRIRAVRQTPLQLAAALAARLSPATAGAAAALAERFGRARWGAAPVEAADAARARVEAELVTGSSLTPRSPEAGGSATLRT
jgi:hypothetical protein